MWLLLSLKYYLDIQGVTGGTDQTSGECSLGHTIPKHLYPKFNGYGDIGQRSLKL